MVIIFRMKSCLTESTSQNWYKATVGKSIGLKAHTFKIPRWATSIDFTQAKANLCLKMHSPKLSQLSSRQEIKPNNENPTYNIIRKGLLIWAFLRLAVSLLWTSALTLAMVGYLVSPENDAPPVQLFLDAFVILIQLVELAMLATFIVAGFKKSVRLYLIYYRYCIFTLIIYVMFVTLCLSLDYEYGRYFGEFYIIYNYYVRAGIIGDEKVLFFIASIFDVGLEILLIFLIKKLITNYQSYDNNYTASEHV